MSKRTRESSSDPQELAATENDTVKVLKISAHDRSNDEVVS